MDERDVVELSLRLPAGELGQLARLMEQVRGILAMERSGAVGPAPGREAAGAVEREVNTAFDAARFQRLEEAKAAVSEERGGSEITAEDSGAVMENRGLEAKAAAVGAENETPEAEAVRSGAWMDAEAVSVEAEVTADLEAPAVETETLPGPEDSVGSVEAAVRAELLAASAEPADNGARLSIPLPPVPKIQETPGEARRAGIAMEARPAEAQSRAFAAVEELVSAGPAPLTAESVALAFQRDDRRYDNGFPLY